MTAYIDLFSINVLGLSPIQKCTEKLRMLAYGLCSDAMDEYVRISESTASVCLKRFVAAGVDKFGDEYLRVPTADDVEKHITQNAESGFVGKRCVSYHHIDLWLKMCFQECLASLIVLIGNRKIVQSHGKVSIKTKTRKDQL